MKDIDAKLDSVSTRLDTLESNFKNKCDEIDELKNSKADSNVVDEFKGKIGLLENFKVNYEKAQIMKESYDKRLNVLIHGVKEDNNNAWKKRETPVQKFEDFLENGLKIKDLTDIEYSQTATTSY